MPSTGESQEWPRAGLDVGALVATGWRPVPFQEFILKVHSRCNLACDYCYVYEAADQSWRSRPAAMSVETVRAMAARVAGDAEPQSLQKDEIGLHGAEPCLARTALIEFTARQPPAAVTARCQADI